MKIFSCLSLAVVCFGFSVQSHAVLIAADTGNPLEFEWNYNTGSAALTGSGQMAVSGFNSNTLTIVVTLTNTAPTLGQGGDRLTAFAFGIGPNATGITFQDATDGGMTNASLISNGVFPSNVPGVEICAFGGPNCNGGANGGIWAGTSDTFTLLLSGTWGTGVDIAPIGVRYQTGPGSFTFAASIPPPPPPPPVTQVPEPSVLALLGMGLFGLAVAVRRRNAAV